MCKWRGQKPTLNARDLESLRRHCIKIDIILRILPRGVMTTLESSLMHLHVKTLPCESHISTTSFLAELIRESLT